jgi:hypothetical protein
MQAILNELRLVAVQRRYTTGQNKNRLLHIVEKKRMTCCFYLMNNAIIIIHV